MNEKYESKSEFVVSLGNEIMDFIRNGAAGPDSEMIFNDLSMRLFEYQYNANIVYRKYCDKKGVKPGMVKAWMDVPAVPAVAFKEVELRTISDEETVQVLTSSGTSNPEKRARISLNETQVKIRELNGEYLKDRGYYKSPDEKIHALLLAPDPALMPSAAAGMSQIKILIEGHSIGNPEFFISPKGFDFSALAERLKLAEKTGEPVFIAGATFAYVHFFDFCQAQNITFKLPAGSRAMDGGGNKGKGRELSKEDYRMLAEKILGIPQSHMINHYGLIEMEASYVDNAFYNHVRGISEPRAKMIPHFARVVVVDPDTLVPLAKGEKGLLRQHSVANLTTVQAVLTDDMGYEIGSGFEITGRARDAESRGCSIAYDELISAQKS